MNKKGVTLVELIIAIAILGILTVLAGPAVFKIRETVLNNSLESKISLIKSAAYEFGSDNIMSVPSIKAETYETNNYTAQQMNACNQRCIAGNGVFDTTIETDVPCPINQNTFNCRNHCKVVSVKALIQRGYLAGDSDNKEILLNPINEVSLNETEVCITFDSEKALERKLITYIFGENNLYN